MNKLHLQHGLASAGFYKRASPKRPMLRPKGGSTWNQRRRSNGPLNQLQFAFGKEVVTVYTGWILLAHVSS